MVIGSGGAHLLTWHPPASPIFFSPLSPLSPLLSDHSHPPPEIQLWAGCPSFVVSSVRSMCKATRKQPYRVWRSFKLRRFSIAVAISIVALSTGVLTSCKYLYVLSTYMIM